MPSDHVRCVLDESRAGNVCSCREQCLHFNDSYLEIDVGKFLNHRKSELAGILHIAWIRQDTSAIPRRTSNKRAIRDEVLTLTVI